MLPPDTIDEIEGYWAGHLGCPPHQMFENPVVVLPHSAFKGYQGLFLVRRGDSCIVTAPAELMDVVHTLVHGASVGEVFGTGLWRDHMPDLIDCVVGPGYVGYADASNLQPADLPGAVPIAADERADVELLRLGADPETWERSGVSLDHPALFGYWVNGELVGVANYEIWGERIAHIGVLVHPNHRGQGYGQALVATAARHAIEQGLIAQFRMLKANQPALAIARRLGFEPYAETFAIGLNVPRLIDIIENENQNFDPPMEDWED